MGIFDVLKSASEATGELEQLKADGKVRRGIEKTNLAVRKYKCSKKWKRYRRIRMWRRSGKIRGSEKWMGWDGMGRGKEKKK